MRIRCRNEFFQPLQALDNDKFQLTIGIVC